MASFSGKKWRIGQTIRAGKDVWDEYPIYLLITTHQHLVQLEELEAAGWDIRVIDPSEVPDDHKLSGGVYWGPNDKLPDGVEL